MALVRTGLQAASFPNQFSANNITATSTQVSTGFVLSTACVDFKFNAGLIKIVVDSGGPAYLQLNGNTATTNDYKVTSGDLLTDWYDLGVGLAGISIGATSTGLAMRLGAWG